jgi:hypothetical protein
MAVAAQTNPAIAEKRKTDIMRPAPGSIGFTMPVVLENRSGTSQF